MSKKIGSLLLTGALLSSVTKLFWPLPIQAATANAVVINEVAWAGSIDSATDEWLELYNTTSSSIDLTGWHIEDDSGAQTYDLDGTIASHQFYLLESKEIATSLPGDSIHTLSLSNSGDSLVLKDATGTTIDQVNSSSGAWYAGSNTTHSSMERIDPLGSGDSASNWKTTTTTSTATGSNGTKILGTPRSSNSGTSGTTTPSSTLIITPHSNKTSVAPNDTVTVTYTIPAANNISNYGLEISYNPEQLQYISAAEGNFLKATSETATSFQAGLLNNQAGTIIIGNARTERPLQGTSSSVEKSLFSLTFKALVGTNTSEIKAQPSSFISTPESQVNSSIGSITITVANASDLTVTNLLASPGEDRYSIALHWQALAEPDVSYDVYRQDQQHQYQLIGNVHTATFTDDDTTTNGGNIIPTQTYHYQVIAKKGTDQGPPTTTSGTDNRGLRADNNRSDRVDGKDLEQLAHFWTIDDSDSTFPSRVDTNRDGIVSGNDLIDLAVDWAKSYSN